MISKDGLLLNRFIKNFRQKVSATTILALLLVIVSVSAQTAQPNTLPQENKQFSFSNRYLESVGDSESIPNGIVTALSKDASGRIWIGTQAGLVRYDGYLFRKFTHDPNDADSILGDYVQSLWAAPDGRIWVGNASNGLSVFDPKTEKFQNYRHTAEQTNGLSGGAIRALVGDKKGGIWVGTNTGLNYLAPGAKDFVNFRHDANNLSSLSDDRVRSLLVDQKGQLWIGSFDGIQQLSDDKKHFKRIASDASDPLSFAGQEIRALFEAQDGKIWIGTRKHGLAWMNANDTEPHRIAIDPQQSGALSHEWIQAIAQPLPDQIWVATVGGGINILSSADPHVTRKLRADSSVGNSLALDTLGALLVDHSGLVWVGTWGAGLQRHNINNQAIQLIRHSLSAKTGLSDRNVMSILGLGTDKILVGTFDKGIDIIDRQLGLIGGYRPNSNNPSALPDGPILSLAQTPDGTIWAGTRKGGVARLKQGGKDWQLFSTAHGLPNTQVNRLLVTNDGKLWIGTDAGLALWIEEKQQFLSFKLDNHETMRAKVNALAEDPKGKLWIGSDSGLWSLDLTTHELHLTRSDPKNKEALSSDFVSGLLVDRKGQVWVDTSLGLDRLISNQSKNLRFEHISKMAGREGLYFGGNLLEDEQGRIWTQWFVLDPDTLKIQTLSKSDGLDVGSAWIGSYAKTKDGLFLYGGSQGLAVVNPSLYTPWSFSPSVIATELKIDGLAASADLINPTLILSPNQHNFSISFAALDYSSPQKNAYSYRLENYDKDWLETDANHRSASYGNLWPGKYTLHVRGSNRSGDWSPHQLQVEIQVLPAFWQTTWFYILIIFSFCTLLYFFVQWRISRFHLQARNLQKLIDARTADILKLGEIGQELTATLDTEVAFERIYKQIIGRVNASLFSISIIDEVEGAIHRKLLIIHGKRINTGVEDIEDESSLANWCIRERKAILTSNNVELQILAPHARNLQLGARMESIVYLPLILEKRVVGCISIQNEHENAYSETQYDFLRILADYIAIAVANSRTHSALGTALTHLQKAQEQLVLQEKMAALGRLVAGVAHELNTPIGNSLLSISTQREHLVTFNDSIASVGIKRRSFDKFLQVVDDTSDFVMMNLQRCANLITSFKSIAVDRHEYQRRSFSLDELINYVAKEFETHLVTTRYVFEITPFPSCQILNFPDAIIDVLSRLLENALVHGLDQREEGKITLQCELIDDVKLVIMICDDGNGISAENINRVFDPFFTTRLGHGTSGLGLHIAHNTITQVVGGTLTVKSELNCGSVFTLEIPINNEAIQREENTSYQSIVEQNSINSI